MVTLEEPADCTRFHVQAAGPRDEAGLAAALARSGAGRMQGDDAFIVIDAVRSMAKSQVDEGWYTDFAQMLDYAAGKGWRDAGGGAIQAHVEWETPA